MDGGEECTHPACAGTRYCQARVVDLHGTQELCAGEEREEVHDVIEDVVPGAGGEEPIVCREERETRCGRTF